jgi:hypothetical protein
MEYAPDLGTLQGAPAEFPGISVRNIGGVICNNAATPTPHPTGPQPKVFLGLDKYFKWSLPA